MIILKNTKLEDLETLYFQQQDPEANVMAAFPARDYFTFMQHWNNKILNNPNNIAKTIFFNSEIAGSILSWQQESKHFVGYWIGREFWAKGIASQALSLLLEEISIRPIYAYVAEHNKASIRVLQKQGFQFLQSEKLQSPTHKEIINEWVFVLK